MKEEQIFQGAIEQPAGQRTAFLLDACGDDVALRERVEVLLKAHANPGSFLESPAIDVAATADQPPISERPGTVIGPYKLLQQIGEGGMGVVFMAEQDRPIQRTVALKIIKPGMDTRQVIARFEAERQALAMMDHPNIAKVLDAGTTDTGRPYFVMDLVKGVPITKYCDEKQLSLRERLELFIEVCQAVQHAHQKGIIHRDIKPTNVIVAEYDNHAVPKVIDFGVAKATAQKLTERTMFTEYGQVIGTVEYMSPEQAKLNQLDIDTRSDIYSLGVLLYELLTGSTPFEQKRLHEAAFDEVLRIIREEEPPKPSTRLSSIDTLPSVAANRHTEPARLSKDVRGELDWIVMKCLEKDRNRRYETANGMARDIERYLHDEPVQACPPSTVYRFKKFIRRNKGLLAAVTAIALAMVAGTGVATWQAVRAAEARRRAETEATKARAVADVLTEMLSQASPYGGGGANYTVRHMLDDFTDRLENNLGRKFEGQPGVEAEVRGVIGQAYGGLLLSEMAAPHLKRALELLNRVDDPAQSAMRSTVLTEQGWIENNYNRLEEAERRAREALAVAEEAPASVPGAIQARMYALQLLQHVLVRLGRRDEADEAGRRGLAIADLNPGEAGARRWALLIALADSATARSRRDEAESYARQAVDSAERVLGRDSLPAAWGHNQLARCLNERGKHEEAEAHARQALAIVRRELGEKKASDLWILLGDILTSRGDKEALARFHAEHLAALERGVADHSTDSRDWITVGEARVRKGQVEEGLSAFERASLLAGQDRGQAQIMMEACDRLARSLLYETKNPSAAQRLCELGVGLWDSFPAADHTDVAFTTGPGQQDSLTGANAARQDSALVASLLHVLSDAYADQGKSKEGLAAIERAVAMLERLDAGREPSDYTGWSRQILGNRLREVGRHGDAIRELVRAGEIFRRLRQRDGLERNVQWLRNLLDTPELLDAAAQKIIEAEMEAEVAAFEALCREAIRQHPNAADLHMTLADVLREQGKLDDAIEEYSQVIATKPDVAEAWSSRGNCYLQLRQFAKAAEDFSAAIKLKPDRSDAWTGQAFTYFHRQQWEQAVADFTKAIELSPDVHTNWLHRGHAYLQLAQWDKTAADFSKLVEQWPQDSGGWFFLAAAHAQLNQPNDALSDLRHAIDNGFNDIEHLKTYPMFDPIRSHPDFKKLVAELEGKKK